jgi:outer membrane lipoprotein-sorting protein
MYRIVTIILLLMLPAAGSLADLTPEAREWLEKMADLEQSPFEMDYSAKAEIEAMGTTMTINVDGHYVQSDERHMRMTLNMLMAGNEGSTEMSALRVADGSTMWTEVNNPMLGGKQIMKIGLDRMDQMAAANPRMGLAGQWSGMDPVDQIRQLAEQFDFDVIGSDADIVTLSAKMTPEGLPQLGIPPETASQMTIVMVIDKGTGFPKEAQVGGEKPLVTMTFTDFKQLDRSTIEPGSFSYSPPEGVRVMDLGVMLDAMGGGAAEPK